MFTNRVHQNLRNVETFRYLRGIELVLRVEDREHLLVQDAEEPVHHHTKVGVAACVVPRNTDIMFLVFQIAVY